ncbi:MAG TPA: S41 family peptidase [Gemmatimonadota bacterium]|jgi:carboxyl-terminal processing protease|nr:S41 family peptidase [Gemmatimonadota bacterium]
MIRKRFGTLFVLLFFLAVLTGGVIYDDLSASNGDDPYRAIKLLNEAIHQVSDKYVDPISSDSLYMRALEGMLLSLDPYSQLLSPSEYNDLRIHTQGNYEGLGIRIDIVDNVLTVISPIEGTPAYKAGLRAGDRIMKVDGVSTEGWSEEKAVQELRGPQGSEVELIIGRDGLDEPIQADITRKAIKLSAVPYAFMLDDGIGYVRFTQFSEHGRDEIRDAIRELERQGMRALILDVRQNPGGLLDQAIEVSDLFLPKGVEIVSTKGRAADSDRQYSARDNNDFSVHPMVLLIDNGSASATEILAGALQDHDRALIVGETSWGKGLVQSLFSLDDGYFLKLTTARYYTPSGRSIQRDDEIELASFEGLPSEAGTLDSGTESIPDSLVFDTDMGRTVYGGGGVMPDVVVRAEKLSEVATQLLEQAFRKNAFFSFAVHYHASHPSLPRTFAPDAALMDEFRTYLQRDKGIDFSDEAFDAEGDYIRDYLRYTLISQYHGEGVARQAVMEADLPLATAVDMLNEADTLADLFRLADRARQAQADQVGAETALEDGSEPADPMLLDRSTPR